jgi:hypothetical protein
MLRAFYRALMTGVDCDISADGWLGAIILHAARPARCEFRSAGGAAGMAFSASAAFVIKDGQLVNANAIAFNATGKPVVQS